MEHQNNINGVISTSPHYKEAWRILCYESSVKGKANPKKIHIMGKIIKLEDILFGAGNNTKDIDHSKALDLFDQHAAYQLAINDYDEIHEL